MNKKKQSELKVICFNQVCVNSEGFSSLLVETFAAHMPPEQSYLYRKYTKCWSLPPERELKTTVYIPRGKESNEEKSNKLQDPEPTKKD